MKRAAQPPPGAGLGVLDCGLITRLEDKTIRLVRTSWLCKQAVLQSRGEIEALEAQGGEDPFLSPAEAVGFVNMMARRLGVLSYGWLGKGHPDKDGALLAIVRRHLEATPSIEGLFWDFASLYQKPRTAEQDVMFGNGLGVMGDLYASPTATAVLRIDEVPPRPAALDGVVRVCGLAGREEGWVGSAGSASIEDAVRAALAPYGNLAQVAADGADEVVATFESHDDARAAAAASIEVAAALGAGASAFAMLEYNDRPPAHRGWVVFEEAVATEVNAWVNYDATNRATLAAIPTPKVVVISSAAEPVEMREERDASVGLRSRVQEIITRIEAACFTSGADQPKVVGMYRDYYSKMHNALTAVAPGGIRYRYEGERNAAGQPHGRGTQTFANGDVYIGEFKHGAKHGWITVEWAGGDRFEGMYEDDLKHGKGTYYFADARWRSGGGKGSGLPKGNKVSGLWVDDEFQDGKERHADRHLKKSLKAPRQAMKAAHPRMRREGAPRDVPDSGDGDPPAPMLHSLSMMSIESRPTSPGHPPLPTMMMQHRAPSEQVVRAPGDRHHGVEVE